MPAVARGRHSPVRPKGPSVSAIAAENISKHWTTADGQVRAVDGLSFAFDEGTLSWTQARLLIAIARPETEAAWLAIAGGRISPAKR